MPKRAQNHPQNGPINPHKSIIPPVPALFTIDSTMVKQNTRRKPSRVVPKTAPTSLLTFETPPNHFHSKRRDHPPDPRKLQNHQFPYEKYTFLNLRPEGRKSSQDGRVPRPDAPNVPKMPPPQP